MNADPPLLLYIAVPVVTALAGALVGAFAAFRFNRELNAKNQEHERRVALFTFELEELRKQLELTQKALKVAHRLHAVVASLAARAGAHNQADKGRCLAEAAALEQELKAAFLTTTPAFNAAWGQFSGSFVILTSELRHSRDATDGHVQAAIDHFHEAFLKVNSLIYAGLRNFKEGRPVYPELPLEDIYGDVSELQKEYHRRTGLST